MRLLRLSVLSLLVVGLYLVTGPRSASADPLAITIVNATTSTFQGVFVSPSSNTGVNVWDVNILNGSSLPPGQSGQITTNSFSPGMCSYDIMVSTPDGRIGLLEGVNLCTTTTFTIGD
jgi:hypothetical protein